MKEDISCILTLYKRPQNIKRQLAALKAQSIQPSNIYVWQNSAPGVTLDSSVLSQVTHVKASTNLGVWPRFLFGMELPSKYVCVFDDDTVPGRRWLENCIRSMKRHRGLMGTIGLVFKGGRRKEWSRFGWARPNTRIKEVDIVGHSWFFERDWLRYYALEPRRGFPTCGEDYHFSVAIQKHLKLGTYVPPHPPNAKEWWGSLHGRDMGMDNVALCKNKHETIKKNKTHAAYLAHGWRPLQTRGR